MTTDISEIKLLANMLTGGQWKWDRWRHHSNDYIEAVSPENVLEIIAELTALREKIQVSEATSDAVAESAAQIAAENAALRNRIDALKSSHDKYTEDMETYNKRRDEEVLALRAVRDAALNFRIIGHHELAEALLRAKEVLK